MECDLHLPSVLTPPKGGLLEDPMQLGCTQARLWPCEEHCLCFCSLPPSLKDPWTRSGWGRLEPKMPLKGMLLVAPLLRLPCWRISWFLTAAFLHHYSFHISISKR